MIDLQQQAIEFRTAYGVPNTPTLSQMQMELIREEYAELRDSHYDVETTDDHTLKELADLVYVCFQYAENREWDLQEALRRVHASNMSKLGDDGQPIRRDDGKVLKGPNYRPADLNDLVKHQA